MRLPVLAVLLGCLAPVTATAQSVNGATARAPLFDVNGVSVRVFNLQTLSEQDQRVIGEVARQQKYYGAVAISPDEGLMSEATLAAANHHAVAPAERQALAACDAVRRPGSAPCVIAAHILPAGHTARALQLSVEATAAFRTSWRGAGPRAMALSPATGEWSIVRGAGARDAALDACNRKAQPKGALDCLVAIAE